MGCGSSKEEIINSMGQYGKPIGMARKGATKMEAQRPEQTGASAKTMSKPMKGIKRGSTSPRAHALHTVRDSINAGRVAK